MVSVYRTDAQYNRLGGMRHSKETKDKAAALYAEGLPVAEIGRRLGVPKSTAHRWLSPAARELYETSQRQIKDGPELRARRNASSRKSQSRPEYKAHRKEYMKAYRRRPEAKQRKRAREQTPEYKERKKEYMNEYRQSPEVKERARVCDRAPKRKERKNACTKERRIRDPVFRVLDRLRVRTYKALKGSNKSANTEKLLGVSAQSLRERWDTEHGPDWRADPDLHIDHIRPCASFDLTDPAQQRLCFNHRNLQLLTAADNIRKGDRWNEEMEIEWASMMRSDGWTDELFLVFGEPGA